MAELFTQEQARAWLRANNLKTGKSIQQAVPKLKAIVQIKYNLSQLCKIQSITSKKLPNMDN